MPTTTIYQFRLEAHMDAQCLYKSEQNIKMYPFRFRVHAHAIGNVVISVQWLVASETYTPKTKPPNPSNIKDFRPIALMNVEGKLLFSLLSRRLEDMSFPFLEDMSFPSPLLERLSREFPLLSENGLISTIPSQT